MKALPGPLGRGYARLLRGMFAAGALVLGAVTVLILHDVIARNLGFSPFPHTLALTEYGLYFMTLLGAPWLVREKHHVYIQLLIAVVPRGARLPLAKGCYLACALACAVICWYAFQVTVDTFARGGMEVRSFDMPRWVLFSVMPLSFAMLTIEFCRYLLGFDSMYDAELGIRE